MSRHLLPYCFFLWALPTWLFSQEKINLQYYLPNVAYDAAIPTPAKYLGYEVGEWHASHDQLVGYMRALAAASPRVQLQEYGRSHENRPLVCLTITSPDNHGRTEAIKAARQGLRTGQTKPADALPVAYMGYSIHGNEASGTNASLMVAYYLAAAQSDEVKQLLEKNVILLDPCFNPDGMQRFSTWVNSRRSKTYVPDPTHDEFNETWPGGRTNHYWFDLNRDWLVAQQPESVGRVALFQEWLPNILTDHHEMGSNATFFFQPGVPSRVNPLTPARNQELTGQIAQYHAKILSDKKILFYSGENYDDFYYGKGSTYPDAQGSIGILFEQGSSRGSAQETDNGLLTFPYSVRNQVLTSLSTLQALRDMGGTLNAYLHEFYRNGEAESRREANAGFLIGTHSPDRYALQALVEVLQRHRVQMYPLTKAVTVNGQQYRPNNDAFFIPFEQPQYRLIKGMFDRSLSFQDSIFYDISAWTLPDAFGVPWTAVSRSVNIARESMPLAKSSICTSNVTVLPNPNTSYAYAIHPDAYETPKLLAELLRRNVRVRVATKPFRSDSTRYAAGTLVVAFDRQNGDPTAISQLLGQSGCRIGFLGNGFTPDGPDLGSSNFQTVRAPKVVLLTGRGINALDAGEVWHLLDTRYGMPPTLLDVERAAQGASLDKYNVVVLADGNPNPALGEKLKDFVTNGGTLIATGTALRWVKAQNLLSIEFRNPAPTTSKARRAYDSLTNDNGALALPGAIFDAQLDLTHPICYGYSQARMPLFLGDAIFPEVSQNPYATPVVFAQNPLLAGYVHASQKPLVSGAAAVMVGSLGRGRVIAFTANPNFRAFWYSTNRLFANAVFFGNLINAETTERKR